MKSDETYFKEKNSNGRNELFIILAFFLFALFLRVIGLGKTIIADEQLWIVRSMDFAKALFSMNPADTRITGHPGVITMWLGAFSIGIAKLVLGYKQIADLLLAAQLPFAMVTAAAVAAFYSITRKAFNFSIAIYATIFLCCDVFFLAYSRIIHLDAVLTSLMILSFLSILVFYNDVSHKRWLVISACLGGMSVLAKVSGVFMAPMAALITIIYMFKDAVSSQDRLKHIMTRYLAYYGIWIGFGLIAIFILWPAMWTDPMNLVHLFSRAPGMVAHEYGAYVLGKPIDDPGMAFYLLVLLFRTSPLSFIFLIVGILFAILRLVFYRGKFGTIDTKIWLCLAFVIFFLIMMSIPGKKVGRYILPIFPMIDLIAGISLYLSIDWIKPLWVTTKRAKATLYSVSVILAFVLLYPVVSVFPYFLSFYNPLVGGPATAEKVLLVGRGEGMDLVAKYFNQKSNAESLTVASEFAYLLNIHFKGQVLSTTVGRYQDDALKKSDYLVVYISGIQKQNLRTAREVLEYHQNHAPEKIIRINGINYAYIYNLKHLVLQ